MLKMPCYCLKLIFLLKNIFVETVKGNILLFKVEFQSKKTKKHDVTEGAELSKESVQPKADSVRLSEQRAARLHPSGPVTAE